MRASLSFLKSLQNLNTYCFCNMYLPMINNRNLKQFDKNNDINQGHAAGEQFGLGIQVIKIQSSKAIDPNLQKQKKLTKNIENPILEQPTVQPFKRTPILPSLSTDKKSKTGGLNDTFKERKATIEKKKLIIPTDSIKQFEDKHRPLEKKVSSMQQVNKTQALDQPSTVINEKQIIQKHYRTSMNELLDFYEKFDERQTQNLKEIRRLKKLKDTNEEELTKELKLRQNKTEMAIDLAHKENLTFFDPQQEYDQFSLTNYIDGGQRFQFEDIEPTFQY